jgi:hypothetical protein
LPRLRLLNNADSAWVSKRTGLKRLPRNPVSYQGIASAIPKFSKIRRFFGL